VYGDVSEIVEEVVRLNFGNRVFGDDGDAWQPADGGGWGFSAVPRPRS
jgi:hypothetical protein